MRRTEIHLSEPFKEVLASLLALPSTHVETDELHFPHAADLVLRKNAKSNAEVKEALRALYEAAHGRQVETQIGFVAIAPPVAGFLKEMPYYVATQHEFFLEAFTRILAGGSPRNRQTNGSCTPISKHVVSGRGIGTPRIRSKRANGNVRLCPTSRSMSNQRIMHP